MGFVINSNEWNFDNWTAEDILGALEAVLERVAVAKERNEKVWIGDDFQTKSMLGGKDLWSFLGNEELANISQDVKNELAAWMSTVSYYADEEIPPGMMENLDVAIDGGTPEQNLDIAWVHHSVRNRNAIACLSLRESGVKTTVSMLGNVDVHWVLDEDSVVEFWRDAIDVERDCRSTIERIGPSAFPNLYFQPAVWNGLDDLSDGYVPLRHIIRTYLKGLNDEGCWIFSSGGTDLVRDRSKTYPVVSVSNKLVIERFGAIQLNVSPEKAGVKSHEASRIAREVVVKGRTLYCEWHGKFEPHQNRIYFHPPVPESNNRIVIGIFNRHL